MILRIKYDDIKKMKPMEMVSFIKSSDKKTLKSISVNEFIDMTALNNNITDIYYSDIFYSGVYVFLNKHNQGVYVGKSKDGFYGRIMSQLTTKYRKGWGWNALLQKIAVSVEGKSYENINDQDLENAYTVLIDYFFIMISIGSENISLTKLENLLIRAFNVVDSDTLLNNSNNTLRKFEQNLDVNQIVST